MSKTFYIAIVSAAFLGFVGYVGNNTNVAVEGRVDKILKAKQMARSIVNYPDTLFFHEFDTKVEGNSVTLTFTANNAFGVPETHTAVFNVTN